MTMVVVIVVVVVVAVVFMQRPSNPDHGMGHRGCRIVAKPKEFQ